MLSHFGIEKPNSETKITIVLVVTRLIWNKVLFSVLVANFTVSDRPRDNNWSLWNVIRLASYTKVWRFLTVFYCAPLRAAFFFCGVLHCFSKKEILNYTTQTSNVLVFVIGMLKVEQGALRASGAGVFRNRTGTPGRLVHRGAPSSIVVSVLTDPPYRTAPACALGSAMLIMIGKKTWSTR